MSITIDKNGYPVLSPDKLELAIYSPVAEGRPGNDFHDAQGKFTFLPSGIRFIAGKKLVEAAGSSVKKAVGDRAVALGANQVGAKIVNGKLHIVMMRDGRKLHSFTISKEAEDTRQNTGEKENIKLEVTPELEDEIVELARDLGLSGEELDNFIRQKTDDQLGPSDLAQLVNLVEQQRMTDLVSYLHTKMRVKYKDAKVADSVRLSVGRGYLKKIFSNLEQDKIGQVLSRLQARGWSEAQVQEAVADVIPEKFLNQFNQVYKEARPDA